MGARSGPLERVGVSRTQFETTEVYRARDDLAPYDVHSAPTLPYGAVLPSARTPGDGRADRRRRA
ncbi:resuscitation-promoting factor, partial [Streptomyces sp. SID5606]|nr:resuscitation-promoting factor [Streptomyces sp. SID5606]